MVVLGRETGKLRLKTRKVVTAKTAVEKSRYSRNLDRVEEIGSLSQKLASIQIVIQIQVAAKERLAGAFVCRENTKKPSPRKIAATVEEITRSTINVFRP